MDKLSSMFLSILFYNLGNSFHGEMSFLIFSILLRRNLTGFLPRGIIEYRHITFDKEK